MRNSHALIVGLAAALSASSLTACRLGNKVEHLVVDDPSGFYRTEARRLSYCTKTNHETCGIADLLPLPDKWDTVITDPVYLGMSHADSKKGALINKDDLSAPKPRGILLALQGSGHFTFTDLDFAPEDLAGDGSCISQVSYLGAGLATRVPSPALGGNPIAGTLQFDVRRLQTFRGSCFAFFSSVRSCYEDASKCGMPSDAENATVQDHYRNFFQKYVLNIALKVEDIPNLTELSYSLSFE